MHCLESELSARKKNKVISQTLTCCVSSGKLLHHSEPLFSHLLKVGHYSSALCTCLGCWKEQNELMDKGGLCFRG